VPRKTEVSSQELAGQTFLGRSQEEVFSFIYFLKEMTSELSRSVVYLFAVGKQDTHDSFQLT
jgi:hypothetical protein